jgi:hypothetical protein
MVNVQEHNNCIEYTVLRRVYQLKNSLSLLYGFVVNLWDKCAEVGEWYWLMFLK